MTFTQNQKFLSKYKKYYYLCHQKILPYSQFFGPPFHSSNFILKSFQLSSKSIHVFNTSKHKPVRILNTLKYGYSKTNKKHFSFEYFLSSNSLRIQNIVVVSKSMHQIYLSSYFIRDLICILNRKWYQTYSVRGKNTQLKSFFFCVNPQSTRVLNISKHGRVPFLSLQKRNSCSKVPKQAFLWKGFHFKHIQIYFQILKKNHLFFSSYDQRSSIVTCALNTQFSKQIKRLQFIKTVSMILNLRLAQKKDIYIERLLNIFESQVPPVAPLQAEQWGVTQPLIRNSLKGVLLVNFPEKEKNFLIKNLAAENKIALITQSASLLLKDSRNMDDLLGVDDPIQILFDKVKTCIPCICFINNLDSIGKQRYEHTPLGKQKSLHWLNNSISLLIDHNLKAHGLSEIINQKNDFHLSTTALSNKACMFNNNFKHMTILKNLETNHIARFKNVQNDNQKILNPTVIDRWRGRTGLLRTRWLKNSVVSSELGITKLASLDWRRTWFNLLGWSSSMTNPQCRNKNPLQQIKPFFYLLVQLLIGSKDFVYTNANKPSFLQFSIGKDIPYIISYTSVFDKLFCQRCFVKKMYYLHNSVLNEKSDTYPKNATFRPSILIFRYSSYIQNTIWDKKPYYILKKKPFIFLTIMSQPPTSFYPIASPHFFRERSIFGHLSLRLLEYPKGGRVRILNPPPAHTDAGWMTLKKKPQRSMFITNITNKTDSWFILYKPRIVENKMIVSNVSKIHKRQAFYFQTTVKNPFLKKIKASSATFYQKFNNSYYHRLPFWLSKNNLIFNHKMNIGKVKLLDYFYNTKRKKENLLVLQSRLNLWRLQPALFQTRFNKPDTIFEKTRFGFSLSFQYFKNNVALHTLINQNRDTCFSAKASFVSVPPIEIRFNKGQLPYDNQRRSHVYPLSISLKASPNVSLHWKSVKQYDRRWLMGEKNIKYNIVDSKINFENLYTIDNRLLFKNSLIQSTSIKMFGNKLKPISKKKYDRVLQKKKPVPLSSVGFKDLGKVSIHIKKNYSLPLDLNKQSMDYEASVFWKNFQNTEASTFKDLPVNTEFQRSTTSELLLNTGKEREKKHSASVLDHDLDKIFGDSQTQMLKITETEIIKRTALLKFLQILDGFHTTTRVKQSIPFSYLKIFGWDFQKKNTSVFETRVVRKKRSASQLDNYQVGTRLLFLLKNYVSHILVPLTKRTKCAKQWGIRWWGIFTQGDWLLLKEGSKTKNAKPQLSKLKISDKYSSLSIQNFFTRLILQKGPKNHDNAIILNLMKNNIWFPKITQLKKPGETRKYSMYGAARVYKLGLLKSTFQQTTHPCFLTRFGSTQRPKNDFLGYILQKKTLQFFSFASQIPNWELYLKNQPSLKRLNLLCVWPSYIEDILGPFNLNDGASYLLPEYFQLLGHGPKLKKQGITLIASTNNLTTLDAALLRPGRFDTIINFSNSFSSLDRSYKILKHSPSLTKPNEWFVSIVPESGGKEKGLLRRENTLLKTTSLTRDKKASMRKREIYDFSIWPSNLDKKSMVKEKKQKNLSFLLEKNTEFFLNNAILVTQVFSTNISIAIKNQFYSQVTLLDLPSQSIPIKTFIDVSIFIQYKLWWSFNNGKLSWLYLYQKSLIPKTHASGSKNFNVFKPNTDNLVLVLKFQIHKIRDLAYIFLGTLRMIYSRFFYNFFQFYIMLKTKIIGAQTSIKDHHTNKTKFTNKIDNSQNSYLINALGRKVLISKAVADLNSSLPLEDKINDNQQNKPLISKSSTISKGITNFYSISKEFMTKGRRVPIFKGPLFQQAFFVYPPSGPQIDILLITQPFKSKTSNKMPTRSPLDVRSLRDSARAEIIDKGLWVSEKASLETCFEESLFTLYLKTIAKTKDTNSKKKTLQNFILNFHMENDNMFLKYNRSLLFCIGDFHYKTYLEEDSDIILVGLQNKHSVSRQGLTNKKLGRLYNKSDQRQDKKDGSFRRSKTKTKPWQKKQPVYLSRNQKNQIENTERQTAKFLFRESKHKLATDSIKNKEASDYNLNSKIEKNIFLKSKWNYFTQSITNVTTAFLDQSSKIWKDGGRALALKNVNINNTMLIKYHAIYQLKKIKLKQQSFFNLHPFTAFMSKRWPEITKSNKLKRHLNVSLFNSCLLWNKEMSYHFSFRDTAKEPFEDSKSSLASHLSINQNSDTVFSAFFSDLYTQIYHNLSRVALLIPISNLLVERESSKTLVTNNFFSIHESYLLRKLSTNFSLNIKCLEMNPILIDLKKGTSSKFFRYKPSTYWISTIHLQQKKNQLKKIPRRTIINRTYNNLQTRSTFKCFNVKTHKSEMNNSIILLKNLVSNEKNEHNFIETRESFQNYKMCRLDISFFLLIFYSIFFEKIQHKKTTINTIRIFMPYRSLVFSHFLLSQNKTHGFSCKNLEILIYNKLKNFLIDL